MSTYDAYAERSQFAMTHGRVHEIHELMVACSQLSMGMFVLPHESSRP